MERERPPSPTQRNHHHLLVHTQHVAQKCLKDPAGPRDGSASRAGRASKTNRQHSTSFFGVCDIISPSKGNTRNIKKLEERKTDPLSLEGYVSSTPLPKAPEKGRGGWLCRDRSRVSEQVSGTHRPLPARRAGTSQRSPLPHSRGAPEDTPRDLTCVSKPRGLRPSPRRPSLFLCR